jgi:hypothetical protein
MNPHKPFPDLTRDMTWPVGQGSDLRLAYIFLIIPGEVTEEFPAS